MICLRARIRRSLFLFLSVFCLVFTASTALAQDDKPSSPEKKIDETNIETQLYILVGTNQEVTDAKLPAVLEPVIKDLRTSLPYKSYRLTGTLLNRVRSEGKLDLRWIGGPLVEKAATTSRTPSFSDFNVNQVKLIQDPQGRYVIRMVGFRFASRIPIETYAVAANTPPAPSISYENTGLNTDISMREGEPVIVGTLNVGPSGDALILVVSARRAPR